MAAFLLTTGIIMLALGLVAYVSSMRDHANDESSALSLCPATLSTRVRAAISGIIPPAIVISIILTLVFYFLR
jgi:hypothetical protein